MIDMNATGKQLRELRKNHGVTQERLGMLVGLTSSTISKMERGLQLPALDVALLLADLYNVYVEDLVVMEEDE